MPVIVNTSYVEAEFAGQDKVADDIEDAVVGERGRAASISSGDTLPI